MTEEKRFQKKKEDFICKRCGEKVIGDGYTDHCPECLWSRHVDVYPGDRKAGCGEMMEPVSMEMKKGKTSIFYRCTGCGKQGKVRSDPRDNQDKILEISRNTFKENGK